ncbi:MAG: hypothetical protein K0U66_06160 [Gammaproteobacteria bacterium]|nr:hypothetical protein [Gammaproteobacteria bacterium]
MMKFSKTQIQFKVRTRLMTGLVLLALSAAILFPNDAAAARKEFWHKIRYGYVSVDYVYGIQSDNPRVRLRDPSQAGTNELPVLELALDDDQRGLRFQLGYDYRPWGSVFLGHSNITRGLELRNLLYDANNVASIDGPRMRGEQTQSTTNYGLVFHTPGDRASFEFGLAFSTMRLSFDIKGTDFKLSYVNRKREIDNDRTGWLTWMGFRFRLGDRWETDLRFRQTLYNDLYDEQSEGEYSIAWAPAPKTELRLTVVYELNAQLFRSDLGFRLYF